MNTWQVQEAKARFSEMLDKVETDGPQVITRYGEEKAVLLTMNEYKLLQLRKPSLVEFLLSGPKFDDLDLERNPDTGREIDL